MIIISIKHCWSAPLKLDRFIEGRSFFKSMWLSFSSNCFRDFFGGTIYFSLLTTIMILISYIICSIPAANSKQRLFYIFLASQILIKISFVIVLP